MGDRTTSQAKSHHQKMLGRYKTVENIIKRLRLKGYTIRQRQRELEVKREREDSGQPAINMVASFSSLVTERREEEEGGEPVEAFGEDVHEEFNDLLNFYAPREGLPW